MEFLAESIGLLDLDSNSRAYVAAAPDNTTTTRGGGGTNSRSFFGEWSGTSHETADYNNVNQSLKSSEDEAPPSRTVLPPNNSYEEDELEQFLFHENNNDESSTSLLSSLSPDTPLTLSASSLNFRSSEEDTTDIANNLPRGDNLLTKTVSHRLTPSGCFSGNIDAITGHPIHGILISKHGSVYEGSFAPNSNNGRMIRHGNGECAHADGSKFVGRYEWDTPRRGVWFGDGWVYEGEFARVAPEKETSASGAPRRRIGISSPLMPEGVKFHGTGRYMKADGYIYQGEFTDGLASGVGKEILSRGRGVYYGEFWEGLRHGVGTLMEYSSEEEEEEEEDVCLKARASASLEEQEDRSTSDCTLAQQLQDAASLTSVDLGEGTDDQSQNGPDFAAGGSSLSFAISDEHCDTTSNVPLVGIDSSRRSSSDQFIGQSPPRDSFNSMALRQGVSSNSKQQHKSKRRKQRYSSGVWIAGQYEIEDSCGILHSGQIVKEEDVTSINKGSGNGSENTNVALESKSERVADSPSLNRTTWDLLPEKWLGLG
jgi:hypothetical protein